MISSRVTGILLILALSMLVSVAADQEVPKVPDHVVISEVMTGKTGATKDEFVELYNPTDSSILLKGWRLSRKTESGAEYNLLTSFPEKSIPAHSFFLVIHKTDYTGSVTGDTKYSTIQSIAADNTVILYSDAGQTVVDKVGYGNASDFETAPSSDPGNDKSIERRPLEEEGSAPCQDTDDNSADFEVRDTPTPMNSNQSPVANAGPDQTVQTGDKVQLDGSGSSDPDSDPLSYRWSFVSKSAGSTAALSNQTIANPTFVADTAGDYVLALVVEDDYGGSDTDQVTITAHAPPTADFTYLPESPTTWDAIQFTDQSSDSDGTVVAWSWNFGDGGSSNEQNPTHRYRLPGTYPVTLEVTDNDGLTGSTVQNVEVALGLGDVDGSGTVDVLDVRIVMQAALGIVALTPEQETAADVDMDGDVDMDDAEMLARYVIGF